MAEILAAARDLLETRGLSEFTIADVAKAIGVSEATVFGYFRSRRELMFQVISNWMIPAIQRMEVDVRIIDGSEARLRFFILRHLQDLANAPGLHRLIYRELHWEDYYGSPLHRLNQRYTRVALWIIEEGKRAGEIRTMIDAEIARDQIFGTLHHVGWRTLMNGRVIDVEQVASQMASQLFRGIQIEQPSKIGPVEEILARLEDVTGRLEQVSR